jgi:hypothetical protein
MRPPRDLSQIPDPSEVWPATERETAGSGDLPDTRPVSRDLLERLRLAVWGCDLHGSASDWGELLEAAREVGR